MNKIIISNTKACNKYCNYILNNHIGHNLKIIYIKHLENYKVIN